MAVGNGANRMGGDVGGEIKGSGALPTNYVSSWKTAI